MHSIAVILEKLSHRINRLVEWALFIIGSGMALVVALQVFFRYGLNHSLFWSEELGRMFLVWLTFLGATVAYKRKAHVGIDVIVLSLPPVAQKVVKLVVLAGSQVFFWFMAYHGFEFFQFIHNQKTASLGFSRQVPFVMVPVSGCILFLHGMVFIMQWIKGEKRQ